MNFIKKIGHVFKRLFLSFFNYQKKAFTQKNLFHTDNLFAALLIFGAFFLLGKIAENFRILDPLGDAFEDVEFTDVVFSQLDKNENKRNSLKKSPEIIIVNIGNLQRPYIATLVGKINEFDPKVIGLDVIFQKEKGPEIDEWTEQNFSKVKNLVFGAIGQGYDVYRNTYDSILFSLPNFIRHGSSGDVKMKMQNDFLVARKFHTYTYVHKYDSLISSFPVKIAEVYNPSSIKKLKKRGNAFERINYIGNIDIYGYDTRFSNIPDSKPLPKQRYFPTINYTRLLEPNHDYYLDSSSAYDMFHNKIVLLGYVGDPIYKAEGEDKFYTPLNEKYIGKTDRDMFGVVVHANAIRTILDEDYINEMPDWLMHVIGILFVWLTLANFRPLYFDHKIWYDGVSKVLGFIITLLIIFVIGFVFVHFDYELKFGSIYFACILLAGDFLEIYYGMIKNVIDLLFKK